MQIGIALIAITEMTTIEDFHRMTKWLILAVAVATIYGLIQWIDFNFFPPGPPTVGLDKFVWRRAFGVRQTLSGLKKRRAQFRTTTGLICLSSRRRRR